MKKEKKKKKGTYFSFLFSFCYRDADWDGAFNFSKDVTFITQCAKKIKGTSNRRTYEQKYMLKNKFSNQFFQIFFSFLTLNIGGGGFAGNKDICNHFYW